MVKILHTADWHLGKKLQEYSRIDEQKAVLAEISDIANTENVDLVVIAGDIFDTFNPSHEAVDLFYKTLRDLTASGTRAVIVISGNHDSTQFIEAPDPLARQLGILFYSRYDTLIPTGSLNTHFSISKSASGFIEITSPRFDSPVRIILAPYANELLLRTYLGEGDREASFRELMASKWSSLASNYCDVHGVNLFVGHFFFMKEGEKPEKEPESERPILHVGGTQAIFTHCIPPQMQYAALGHLHRYHCIDNTPCPVVYSSSPLAYSFSEADQQKQVVIVEAEAGQPVSYRPIPLKEGRPLYRKTFEHLEKALNWLADHPNCYVEMTFATEYAIDAATRKAILSSHERIVNLIPLIRSGLGQKNSGLQIEDLEKDIVTLFSMYYHSEKAQEPNQDLIDLFKEVVSENEDI